MLIVHVIRQLFYLCFFHKIYAATTNEELLAVMADEEVISKITEAGYMKPLHQFEVSGKEDIIFLLTTYHHLFIKVKAMIDQINEGLEVFGIYDYIVRYSDLLRPLMVSERTSLTSSECTLLSK